jgi:hypothetical protein
MIDSRMRWMNAARMGAAVVLGLGIIAPSIAACGSSAEPEQTQGAGSGDAEENDPQPDIEE